MSNESTATDDFFMDFTLLFSEAEINNIKNRGPERAKLSTPTVLVVEDQEFSRRLLVEMLRKDYTCYQAAKIREAVELYGKHVPCMVFLDVELPDVNGHDFAAFIKKHDPDSYIVMVTGNHYEKDVKTAQRNKVQGFIAKPYSQQKIMSALQHYQQTHPKR